MFVLFLFFLSAVTPFSPIHSCWKELLLPKKDIADLCDTQKDIKERVAIVQKRVKLPRNVSNTYILSNIYIDCSRYAIVTSYFDNIKPPDIRKDNEIIASFFSRGINFSDDKNHSQILSHILKNKLVDEKIENEEKKKQFDDALFLTRLCLYQKIKHSEIAKTILFFYTVLKVFNNRKDASIKLSKDVLNIVISKYLSNNNTSLKDIANSLDRTQKRLKVPHEDNLLSSVTMISLYEWAMYHTRNLGNYQSSIATLEMLDSLRWHNNSITFFKRLSDEFSAK